MPVQNSPPQSCSQPPLPSTVPLRMEPAVCNICKHNMVEGDDCCMLNECFHTRSSSRNLFQDNPVFTQNQSGNVSADKTPTPTRDTEVSPHLFSPLQSANPSSAINAAEIEKWSNLVSQRFFKI